MVLLRSLLWVLVLVAARGADLTAEEAAPKEPRSTSPPPAPAEPDPAKEEKPAPKPGSLEAYLAMLDRSNRAIRTLRVPYVQERKVRISRRLRKASGRFTLEIRKAPLGPRVLFEETKPHRMDLLFTDTKVVFHDAVRGQIDVCDPRKGGVKPSEIWVIGRPLSELRKQYTITMSTMTAAETKIYLTKLRMVPRSQAVLKWVKELFVWLRVGDALPLKTMIISPSGEYQIFTFQADRLERNVRLDPGTFSLESAVPTKSG